MMRRRDDERQFIAREPAVAQDRERNGEGLNVAAWARRTGRGGAGLIVGHFAAIFRMAQNWNGYVLMGSIPGRNDWHAPGTDVRP